MIPWPHEALRIRRDPPATGWAPNCVRIFLDSKDLINLFRTSNPMSVAEAREWFEVHGATLVLAQSSVSEFVPVWEADKLRVRSELQELEEFPITYIRHGDIQCRELALAVAAFTAGFEPQQLDPYVPQFWRTFVPLKAANFSDVVLIQEMERRVNFRLHDQVFMLWSNPTNFQNDKRTTVRLQHILDSVRANTTTARHQFKAEIAEALSVCKVAASDVAGFEKWIRGKPSVAPGWRLHYEVLKEWAANVTDNAKDGDLNDVTHLFAIPYLAYATLDRRFVDYATRAARRLRHFDNSIDYELRLFRSFSEMVKAIP